MGDYDWALIDWLNFLTAGNVFLPKTFVRMITNWRVRVQSTSSEFLYSQTLRESEQNSMDLGEIKFVWYQSNPHSLLFMESSFVYGLLFVFVSVLFSETNKMADINSIHKFLELLPGHISWLLYFVLVTNNQGKWSLWEIFRFQLSDDRWWYIMERALFKRMLIEW